MRKIADKAIIVIICCVFSGRSAIDISALLIAVSASCLCQYIGKKPLSLAVQLLYGALCFIEPAFIAGLPVLVYDIFGDRRLTSGAVCTGAFIFALSHHIAIPWSAVIAISGAAMLLCHRTVSFERLYSDYIRTVDTSAEVTKLLKENNRQLVENQQYEVRLATLNERNRIAREIHDNVGHMLSRSILQVQALKLIPDNDLRTQGLTELGETLGSAMSSIRSSVHDLHDDSADLKISIREAVRPLRDKGISVSCECSYSDNVPNKLKMSVISIVKEGVSNIIKHSSCDRVEVTFREQPAFYQLIIADNGVCPETIRENGIGLSNMRGRVEELGGIINISAGNKGFRIFISVRKV